MKEKVTHWRSGGRGDHRAQQKPQSAAGVSSQRCAPRLFLCYLLSAVCASVSVQLLSSSSLTAQEVERQPLLENVRRLETALAVLGQPVPEPLYDSVRELAPSEIESAIDRHVTFVVRIQENSLDVSLARPVIVLQQSGYTAAIIKIVNEPERKCALRINSPQAGPVYAGVAEFSMKRQQQEHLTSVAIQPGSDERFLDVAMYTSEPLQEQLSGLGVEYSLALIYSSSSGQRMATIGFDVDVDDSHAECDAHFDIRPAIPVRVQVRDENNEPSMARITIRDSAGHVYPPQPKRLAPDLFFQPHIYRADGEIIRLPPGHFMVESCRGPEYQLTQQTLDISDMGEQTLDLQLRRWISPADFGFYSGDHHIHAAGCAHYTHPTEGIMPEDMFRQVKGEALNVGCVLTWGPCFDFQRQFFTASAHAASEPLTILKYDLEISGFGSQSLGHVCLLDLKDQTYPGSDGTSTKGWPTWTTPVMRWAKQQGAVTGYAHSASGIHIDPAAATKRLLERADDDDDGFLTASEAEQLLLPFAFIKIDQNTDQRLSVAELVTAHEAAAARLPNLAIPEMNGVGAMEISVTTAEGVCDFISAMDTARIQEWNTWYHLLNCGFPLKVSGETDFPCMSGSRVGQGRVYVHLGAADKLNYSDWCRAVAAGRSYVSDGFAHAVEFQVNGMRPGYGDVKISGGETVKVTALIAFAPETPETVAQGLLVPDEGSRLIGDTVELHVRRGADKYVRGGERTVELIINGEAARSTVVPADGELHEIEWEVPVERSSWIALRQFPQLHTNPVNVLVNDQPIRSSPSSARWCIETIQLLWRNREQQIRAEERAEAKATFERAIQRFQEIERAAAEG